MDVENNKIGFYYIKMYVIPPIKLTQKSNILRNYEIDANNRTLVLQNSFFFMGFMTSHRNSVQHST